MENKQYYQRLRRACVNMAGLSKVMGISPAVTQWRYDDEKVNYKFLVTLVRALDRVIYELIQIRDDATEQAWNMAQEDSKAKREVLEQIERLKYQ